MPGMIFLVAVLVVLFIILLSSIKVVNTGYLYVVERLGQFHRILEPGWHFVIPGVDFVRKKVSTKQQILDVPPQSVITKDNVKISVDNVIFYKMLNAKDAVYNIEDYKSGIVYSATTNIRNILGNMTLDEVLAGRDSINQQLLGIIDEVTDAYGIKVLSVEIKNIIPPAEIQQAMEKQMKAERDKRAMILQAEAERQSTITIAEGRKEAAILDAEAEKESRIRKAAGEAAAIERVAEAKAKEVQMVYEAIKKANPDEKLVQLKSLEALEEVAKGEANKVFIPFEATAALSSLGAVKEILTDGKKKKE